MCIKFYQPLPAFPYGSTPPWPKGHSTVGRGPAPKGQGGLSFAGFRPHATVCRVPPPLQGSAPTRRKGAGRGTKGIGRARKGAGRRGPKGRVSLKGRQGKGTLDGRERGKGTGQGRKGMEMSERAGQGTGPQRRKGAGKRKPQGVSLRGRDGSLPFAFFLLYFLYHPHYRSLCRVPPPLDGPVLSLSLRDKGRQG